MCQIDHRRKRERASAREARRQTDRRQKRDSGGGREQESEKVKV